MINYDQAMNSKSIIVFNIFQRSPKRRISHCFITTQSDSGRSLNEYKSLKMVKRKNVQLNFTFCLFVSFNQPFYFGIMAD